MALDFDQTAAAGRKEEEVGAASSAAARRPQAAAGSRGGPRLEAASGHAQCEMQAAAAEARAHQGLAADGGGVPHQPGAASAAGGAQPRGPCEGTLLIPWCLFLYSPCSSGLTAGRMSGRGRRISATQEDRLNVHVLCHCSDATSPLACVVISVQVSDSAIVQTAAWRTSASWSCAAAPCTHTLLGHLRRPIVRDACRSMRSEAHR